MLRKKKYIEKRKIYSDLKKVDAIRDEDIDFSDLPLQDPKDWKNGKWVRYVISNTKKQPVTLRLDLSIINWFKKMTNNKGYQTAINEVLKEYVKSREKKSA